MAMTMPFAMVMTMSFTMQLTALFLLFGLVNVKSKRTPSTASLSPPLPRRCLLARHLLVRLLIVRLQIARLRRVLFPLYLLCGLVLRGLVHRRGLVLHRLLRRRGLVPSSAVAGSCCAAS